MKPTPFVSGRSARKLLDTTINAQRTQADMFLRIGVVVNDHAEHIQALDEIAKRNLGGRLKWLLFGN